MKPISKLTSAGVAAGLSAGLAALLLAVPVSPPAGDAFAQTKKATQSAKPAELLKLTDEVDDPAVWGKVYPLYYERYLMTREMQPTKYGGSIPTPHTPSEADPRTVTSQSKSEADAGLRTIWQGYAFAADFREDRGHFYMLEDQKYTKRQVVVQQPGTCINCHASTYTAFKTAGDGDITKGFEKINAMPYGEAAKLMKHPVACIDCHDSQTMALRVTKPAFIEGIRAFKASQGIENYDVNKQASRGEMRAFVCGQCHVEYYFKGAEKRLVYPWAKGLKIDQIMAYYDEIGFRDWTHKDTGAAALKAQHPEFEMWNQGIHAKAGVTCADCHMPQVHYKGTTMSDHWVRSPMLNIKDACLTCHRKHDAKVTEQDLKERTEAIQDRHWKLREDTMAAMVSLIGDIKAAKEAGKGDAELKTARYLQRRAQFYLDFVEAENSTGFHAPQEAARILGESMNFARQGQIALRDPGFKPTVAIVDIAPPPAPAAPATR
jgi:nitrite reductase (cytochrome c-552)